MTTRRCFRVVLPVIAFTSLGSSMSAQRPTAAPTATIAVADTIHLVFDQQSRTLSAETRADSQMIASQRGQTIVLRKPAQVQLTVVHTNTGLYDVFITDTSEVPPTYGNSASSDMTAVINTAHSFFPQAFSVLTSRSTRSADVWKSSLPALPPDGATENMKKALELAQEMEPDLVSLDSLFAGPRSIASFRDDARDALQRMRDTTPEQAAQSFRHAIGLNDGARCQGVSGDTLALSTRLGRHSRMLRPRRDSLARALADSGFATESGFKNSIVAFRLRADSALSVAEQQMEPAVATEHLAAVISGACSLQEAPRRPAVSRSTGQRFVVRISARSDADIRPVVTTLPDPPGTVTVTVLPPRPLVTVSAGLSILVAPDARYPTYSTRTDSVAGQKGVQIYQANTTDGRYSWGATVGVSWRFLDWTTGAHLALWLPEVTIVQSQGATGFALGSALSWHAAKLGAGMLWVQHGVLQGNVLGDHIPNAGYLQAPNRYGQPKLYLSFSVFGVPGFTSSK